MKAVPLTGLLLLLASVPTPASAQLDLEHRGDPIAWQYALQAPPGTLRGLFLDEAGRPVVEALVYVDDDAGALSGEDGRCGDLVFRGDGVFVDVVAASTGALPDVPVTLRLQRGDESWEVTETLRSVEGGRPLLILWHRVEEPGVFRIEVSAPGYESWVRDEVFLEPELAVCSVTAEGRRYSVRLRALPG